MLVVGVLITIGLLTNKDIGDSPLIGVIVVVGVGWLIINEIRSFMSRMSEQATSMNQLAVANGWQFETKPPLSDTALVPPHTYLAYSASRLVYSVNGDFNGTKFLLYTFQGALKTFTPGYTIGYETILRIDGRLAATERKAVIGVTCETTEQYTYFSVETNVFTKHEMKRLFYPFLSLV